MMLPDFPRAKKAVSQYFINRIDVQSRGGFLSSIRNIRLREGNGTTALADEIREGARGEIIQSRLEVRDEDLVRDGYRAFLSKVDAVAKEFETQKEKIVMRTMEKSTEATGNVVSARGEPFTPHLIIDALSTMEIEFSKEGKFRPPVLVVGPQLAEVISKRVADWEKDPEYTKAFAELVEKKRQEWRDREASRKLVD